MSDVQKIHQLVDKYKSIKSEISKIIVGQDIIIDQILISLFSGGHALLVGVPGLAKTLMVQSIASVFGLHFGRIQFTPDLMPSDILGSEILDDNKNFKFIKGPIFTHILLADEINRTPPKTQSALLEAMQENAVTINGQNFNLGKLFFVLATQNPIEQEGTYPLPEAQLDRFMFSIHLNYPAFEEEVTIVKQTTVAQQIALNKVCTETEILDFQELIKRIPVTDHVIHYAVNLVGKTRPFTANSHEMVNEYVAWGAGPRASQNIIQAAKTHAAIKGKYSPDIEDVQAVAEGILQHRVIKNYKAEADGITHHKLIQQLF